MQISSCRHVQTSSAGISASGASNSGYNPDSHNQANHRVITMQKKCIHPLGESMSDYEIFNAICERLHVGDVFSEGKTELGWVKQMFYASDLPKVVTWEKFFEKGLFHRSQ